MLWALLAAAVIGTGVAGDPAHEAFLSALERARDASREHRYTEVIALMGPYSAVEDPEMRYTATAEIGRAFYHLGDYAAARRALRESVGIHPERAETAIYLQAAAYLAGDTAQAFLVFRSLLASGARDLYLPVTLSGKEHFLAEPEVQSILAEHAVPIEVRPREASVMGVSLGASRAEVVQGLGATADSEGGTALSAAAGPATLWTFEFDRGSRLVGVALDLDNLRDYTPYRVRLGDGLDGGSTPAAVIARWGAPAIMRNGPQDELVMSWDHGGHELRLVWEPPPGAGPPRQPGGAAVMSAIELRARGGNAPDRMAP